LVIQIRMKHIQKKIKHDIFQKYSSLILHNPSGYYKISLFINVGDTLEIALQVVKPTQGSLVLKITIILTQVNDNRNHSQPHKK